MLDERDLYQALGWLLVIVALGLLVMLERWLADRGGAKFGEFDARHEVIDECFAKGEMTREKCEQGCGRPAQTARGGAAATACCDAVGSSPACVAPVDDKDGRPQHREDPPTLGGLARP